MPGAVPRRGRRVSRKEEQDELIAQYGVLAAINTGDTCAAGREELLSLSAVNYRPNKATRLYSSMRANVGTVYLGFIAAASVCTLSSSAHRRSGRPMRKICL